MARRACPVEGVGVINSSFWRGKRVLVTGHTGFKGAWLSLWLQEMGANLTGYALAPPTEPSLFVVADVGRGMRSVIGDIRDPEQLKTVMNEVKPEVVLHLAAQPVVRQSYNDPVETYSTNVMGLVHLFEAIRLTDTVSACVNVTSDKCYDNREWVYGYRENDSMGGYDPYSSSKGCAELITSAYRRSFFSGSDKSRTVSLASARAGNVIGGGDWASDRLVPDIIRAIAARRPALIRNPDAVRPWQHVMEALSGYLILAERLMGSGGSNYADGWNFGPSPEDTRTVEWVVDKLVWHWGRGASWVSDPVKGPHEARSLSLDCLKANRELNWRPVWSLEETIEKIVDWHRAYHTGGEMRGVTVRQINDYTSCSELRNK
jgi:CDP-glucose 4,6-dehydratase